MPRKETMSCCRMHKGKGVGLMILGLLVLANVYWPYLDWGAFVGAVFVIAGFIKLVTPHKYHM